MEPQQIFYQRARSSVDGKLSKLVFEKLMSETIEDVLSSLGTECKEAVYECLENEYALERDVIPDHFAEFSEVLEQIFGDAALLLEIQMMKELHRRVPHFRYKPERGLTLQDYVDALRNFVCEPCMIEISQ